MEKKLFDTRTIYYLVLNAVILFAFMAMPWISIMGLFSGSALSIPFNIASASQTIHMIQQVLSLFTNINIASYYFVLVVATLVWLIIPIFIMIGLVFLFKNQDQDRFVTYSRRGMLSGFIITLVFIIINLVVRGAISSIVGGYGAGLSLTLGNLVQSINLAELGVPAEIIPFIEQYRFMGAAAIQSGVVSMIPGVANSIANAMFTLGSGLYIVFTASLVGFLFPRVIGFFYDPSSEMNPALGELMVISKKKKKEITSTN